MRSLLLFAVATIVALDLWHGAASALGLDPLAQLVLGLPVGAGTTFAASRADFFRPSTADTPQTDAD
ncbi:MAG: hypothetical protein AAGI91_12915 [Bacteroidota bacterium]